MQAQADTSKLASEVKTGHFGEFEPSRLVLWAHQTFDLEPKLPGYAPFLALPRTLLGNYSMLAFTRMLSDP
jgi:hypothetical protein